MTFVVDESGTIFEGILAQHNYYRRGRDRLRPGFDLGPGGTSAKREFLMSRFTSLMPVFHCHLVAKILFE